MVQKTVNTKVKIGLRSNIMVWDSDICYFRSHYLFNNIILKIQTKRTIIKDSRFKEIKAKKIKPTYAKAAEFSKQKNKKKNQEVQAKYHQGAEKTNFGYWQ